MEWIGIILAVAIAAVAVYYIRRGFRFLAGLIARIPWRWVIVGLLIVILIFWAGSCAVNYFSSSDYESPKKEETVQEDSIHNSAGQQEQKQFSPTPAQQDWTFQTFEQLPKEGKRVYLYPGWAGFPLGGKIKYKTPDGTMITDSDKEVLKPTPAESKSIKQEGWYTFYPYEGKGVKVYNCWTCQQRP